ncbi:MAG: glycosyltransferase family 4 protein [Bacteroidia bacterium]
MTGRPKRKKILMLTAGNVDHSSSRIRAIQFIPYLQKENFDVIWIPRIPVEPVKIIDRILFPFLKRYFFLKTRFFLIFGNWDSVFVQRAFLEEFYLKLIKKRNIPLVYDFDDAIYLQPNDKQGNVSCTGLMVKYAQTVISSTSFLNSFCENHGKTPIVIPTSVDGEVIKPNLPITQKSIPVIGWIGSLTTTIVIKEAEEGLRRLAKRMNYEFMIIGADINYKPEGIPFKHYDWSLEKEPFYLSKMDIGIMPLPWTDYSKGKGGFKLYMYMAAAIPSVATPIGVNADIIIEGVNGFHASNPEEWENKMFKLLNNSELREKMGREGREIFEKNYSVEIAYKAICKILTDI